MFSFIIYNSPFIIRNYVLEFNFVVFKLARFCGC